MKYAADGDSRLGKWRSWLVGDVTMPVVSKWKKIAKASNNLVFLDRLDAL